MKDEDIDAIINYKRSLHPELRMPLTWHSLKRILRKERVRLYVRPIPEPAKLVQFGGEWGIIVDGKMPPRHNAAYAAHELGHLWLHVDHHDGRSEVCFQYNPTEARFDPREDEADYVAHALIYGPELFAVGTGVNVEMIASGAEIAERRLSSVDVEGNKSFALHVAGTSFRQAELERVCGKRTELGWAKHCKARCVPENDNTFDPKAVRVEISGAHVGYIPRHLVREFRRRYCGRPVVCDAMVVGGYLGRRGEDGHFGVRLDLAV